MEKDQNKTYWQTYYEKNKDTERERKRLYYHANKDKYKIRAKQYRDKNIEKIKQYEKEYREKNKDKEKIRSKQWYLKQDPQVLYQKRKDRQIKLGLFKYYITPERCFKLYERNARSRGREFKLSLNEFLVFWQQDCIYCGINIPTVGIDRIDNTKGYYLDNCISCCTICNLMKRSLTHAEFIDQCLLIAERFKQIENAGNSDPG